MFPGPRMSHSTRAAAMDGEAADDIQILKRKKKNQRKALKPFRR
jgi:hypothetical protein